MSQNSGRWLLPNEDNWKPQRVYDYYPATSFLKEGSSDKHWKMESKNGKFCDIITYNNMPAFIIKRSIYSLMMFLINQAIGFGFVFFVIVASVATNGVALLVLLASIACSQFGLLGEFLRPLSGFMFDLLLKRVFLSWVWFRYFLGSLLLPSIELRWIAEVIKRERITKAIMDEKEAKTEYQGLIFYHLANIISVMFCYFLVSLVISYEFPSFANKVSLAYREISAGIIEGMEQSRQRSGRSLASWGSSAENQSAMTDLINRYQPSGFRDPAHWMEAGSGCLIYHPSNVGDNESVSWSGSCSDGFAHGQGVVIWKLNGAEAQRDEVTLDHGLRNGVGYLSFPSGTKYRDTYDQGKRVRREKVSP